jgi:hypothetical protein
MKRLRWFFQFALEHCALSPATRGNVSRERRVEITEAHPVDRGHHFDSHLRRRARGCSYASLSLHSV